MSIFIQADTHFAHASVIRFNNRLKPDGTPILQPGDIGPDHKWVSEEIKLARIIEMDEILIADHNSVVGPKDTTICAGDFAWRFHGKYMSRLNGKLILVQGSHDKMPQEVLKNFTEVHQILKRTFNDNKIVAYITHCPMRSWDGRQHGSFNFHGHLHAQWLNCQLVNQLDIGVDSARIILGSYRPFAIEEAASICKLGHPKVRFLNSIFEDPAAIEDEEDEARGSAAAMYAPKENTL